MMDHCLYTLNQSLGACSADDHWDAYVWLEEGSFPYLPYVTKYVVNNVLGTSCVFAAYDLVAPSMPRL